MHKTALLSTIVLILAGVLGPRLVSARPIFSGNSVSAPPAMMATATQTATDTATVTATATRQMTIRWTRYIAAAPEAAFARIREYVPSTPTAIPTDIVMAIATATASTTTTATASVSATATATPTATDSATTTPIATATATGSATDTATATYAPPVATATGTATATATQTAPAVNAPAAGGSGTCGPTVLVDNGVPALVTGVQVATMQAVLQQYASQDVAPIWPDCDTITVHLVDYPDPYSGTLGWHNYFNSQVVAFFDVMDGGLDYRLISHEVAEAIADPRPMAYVPSVYSGPCDTCAGGQYQGAVLFEREIADPVENLTRAMVGPDGQTYQLADFVLPAFYRANAAGAYDWAGLVQRAQAPMVDMHFLDTRGHEENVAGPHSNGRIGD